jgi:uncharacterized protein (DUF1684 family)
LLLLVPLLCAAAGAQASHQAEIQKWRAEREQRLRANWLTLVGLFWLQEGENRAGSAKENDIELPAPPRLGTFELRGGRTTVRLDPGVSATINGKPAKSGELKPDTPGPPDKLQVGSLTLIVIKRGERYALRLRDSNSKALREFSGLHYFPLDEKWRVTAKFVPAEKKIKIANVLGTVDDYPSPGYAEFTVAGQTFRLEPVLEEPDAKELFFIFRDQTSGKDTYPAGRYLYSGLPRDGKVVLDFNKAYTPPCGFTPYATCPLPPRQNWLKLRIDAGELYSGH